VRESFNLDIRQPTTCP